MNKNLVLTNSLLWASAILASAILEGSSTLTFFVLPLLAVASWLFAINRSDTCRESGASAA